MRRISYGCEAAASRVGVYGILSNLWTLTPASLRSADPPRKGEGCTYLFLFTGLRFSMKAAIPSERSSNAKVE